MTRIYMRKDSRRDQIARLGLEIANEKGLNAVTMPLLATRLGANHQLITYHCGTISTVRQMIAEEAITLENARVIHQALAMGFISTDSLTPKVKKLVQQFLK